MQTTTCYFCEGTGQAEYANGTDDSYMGYCVCEAGRVREEEEFDSQVNQALEAAI